MKLQNAPDLTKQSPRSCRVKLGGFVHLPRMLDKARAAINGKNGEYHYNCPLDQRFFEFTGVDHEQLLAEVAKGGGDGEILAWVTANAKHKRNDVEIAAWSLASAQRAPQDVEMRAFFNELHTSVAPKREDISSWFDLLDVDDYVTFGGKV